MDNSERNNNQNNSNEEFHNIIGLGKFSSRKSYYPVLQHKIIELEEEKLKFERIFSNALHGIFQTDLNGKIIVANPAMVNICGYDSEDELFLLDDIKNDLFVESIEYTNLTEMLSKSSSLTGYETRFKQKSGKHIDVSINCSLQIFNSVEYIELFVQDISEKKAAIRVLQESEKQYKSLFNGMNESVLVIDFSGKLIDVNKYAEKVLGYSKAELLEIGLSGIDASHSEKEIKQLGVSIKVDEILMFETTHKTKDGKIIPIEINSSIIDYQGKKAILSVGRDITKRKIAEEELKKYQEHLEELVKDRTKDLEKLNKKLVSSNKELESFSYSVSHDLRAPLRAISGFTNILKEDYADKLDDEGKRITDIIQASTKRMGNLIDDLLSFSRIGRTKMDSAEINMRNMVNSLFFEVTAEDERQRINIEVSDIPNCFGDSNLMRQVWINLLSNAIKFSSKKEISKIEISSGEINEKIIYSIKDNGAGFDMKYKGKLFGVFQRLHSDKEFEGTGVGLALVNVIVTRHGGKVWAKSNVNEGATFYFSIPIKY